MQYPYEPLSPYFWKIKTKFDVKVELKMDWISWRKEKTFYRQYPTWWETLMTFSWFESKTPLMLQCFILNCLTGYLLINIAYVMLYATVFSVLQYAIFCFCDFLHFAPKRTHTFYNT